ncbi:MAG TPA: hypothetical protein VMR86_02585 [Myxococcota bacterium]|nr:hypothetical protein [Myxococcota bacterium]
MSRIATALALMALWAAPAFGRDVCVTDDLKNPNRFVFSGVSVPPKGKAHSVAGVYLSGSGPSAPFSGSIYRRKSDGMLEIGVFVHSMLGNANDLTAVWVGDPSEFKGTGKYDSDGDFFPDVGLNAVEFSGIECRTVVLP